MLERSSWVAVTVLSIIISGCTSWDGDACDYPASAYSEIAVLGATITKCGLPLSESVSGTYYDGAEPFVTARLNLYFSPTADQESIEFEVQDGYLSSYADTTRYEYFFSQSIGDQFMTIEPNHTTFDPPGPANQYSSAVRLQSFPEEMIVNGNHLVVTDVGDSFAAPARATHVELWFRDTPESERELVRRVPLNSFDFWKRYLEPLIVPRNAAARAVPIRTNAPPGAVIRG